MPWTCAIVSSFVHAKWLVARCMMDTQPGASGVVLVPSNYLLYLHSRWQRWNRSPREILGRNRNVAAMALRPCCGCD